MSKNKLGFYLVVVILLVTSLYVSSSIPDAPQIRTTQASETDIPKWIDRPSDGVIIYNPVCDTKPCRDYYIHKSGTAWLLGSTPIMTPTVTPTSPPSPTPFKLPTPRRCFWIWCK